MASLPSFGRRLSRALLGAGLGLLSLIPPAAAAVAPAGPAFPIDTSPDCQREPDVAALPGGGFVTVWTGGPSGGGKIYLRVYDAARNPVTPKSAVADTGAAQSVPAVAALPDGRFMVVWRDASERILGRLFNSGGAPLGGVIQIGFLFPSFSGAAGPQTPDIAASSVFDGFAVVWNDGGAVFLRRIQENGEPDDPAALLVDAHDPGILGIRVTTSSPSVAFQADSVLVAYTVQVTGVSSSSRILGKRIRAGATPEEEPSLELYVPALGTVSGSKLGVDREGNFMVVWLEAGPQAARKELYGRLFFGFGGPRGGAFRLDGRDDWNLLGEPELLVDPRGSSFLVGWTGLVAGAPGVPGLGQFWMRLFNHLTEPLGPAAPIAGVSSVSLNENAALAWIGDNTALAVVQIPSSSPSCSSSGIAAQAISTGCLPGANRLCLGDGRFQLDTTWTAPNVPGGSGDAFAVSLTRDTGYFLFFGQENVELMVKVLDGRALNGKFWVFYGSLTDVQWTMTVTDLVSGASKTYRNPAGTIASRGDTAALPGADALGGDFTVRAFDAVELDRDALAAPGEAVPAGTALLSEPAAAAGPCTGLCLSSERFDVTATWKDPFNGGQGTGHGVPLTRDTGYFWFFDPSNVELVVKVLDGRAVNGKFWVFYGALTNVEYDIRVRHFSGVEKTYHNPPFRFLSRADTGAFTPSCGCTLPGTGGPVCGKDFRTYASECEALCTGWVAVAHPGGC